MDNAIENENSNGDIVAITRDDVVKVLQSIDDPELFIDIWTLGLIYDIDIKEGDIQITMTFTSMACPAGPQLIEEVRERLLKTNGVKGVHVRVVFDPPWQPSEELKALMGIG